MVAATCLAVAATLVVITTLGGLAPVWLSAAGLAAVVLGAAATRIVWVEVRITRREASFDRARQTEAFAARSATVSAEHTALVERLGSRLRTADADVEQLRTRLAHTVRQRTLAEREASRLRRRLHAVQQTAVTQAPGADAGAQVTREALHEELVRAREALADARRSALSYRQQVDMLRVEVAALQDALVERRAEQADELASWQAPEPDGVVRLASWGGRRHA